MIKNGIVFYGASINEYNIANSINTIHAEVNTCMRVKRSEKKKKINMCVYRTNKAGNRLMMSKPCLNCLKKSYKILGQKNYHIHRFYWFNREGKIQYYTNKKICELIT